MQESARTLSFGERGHLVKTRYRDVAPILDSSLLVRNLDQLEAGAGPKRQYVSATARPLRLILRSDDADARLVDWGAACGLCRVGFSTGAPRRLRGPS